VVTCPWHGWQFDVRTGQHCLNPRLHQPVMSLVVDGDEVFVELPESEARDS
jgi:nitrite reductase (NADH) small subunit